jgi:hypothetical protein
VKVTRALVDTLHLLADEHTEILFAYVPGYPTP